MMQVRKRSRNIGVWVAAIAIAGGLAVCAVLPASAEEAGNMVFYRGGFAGLSSNRGNEVFTDVNGAGGMRNDSNLGWYAGAGLDFLLSKDTWGAMDKTWAVGELGVQFNRFASQTVRNNTSALLGGRDNGKTQLTMVTIDVSPKIKFREGQALRPWIIPVGLDIHVISPPSNATQYLDIGLQFGAGAEYQVWKAFKLGVDARFHLAAGMTNTTNNYFTVGPYVGVSF